MDAIHDHKDNILAQWYSTLAHLYVLSLSAGFLALACMVPVMVVPGVVRLRCATRTAKEKKDAEYITSEEHVCKRHVPRGHRACCITKYARAE